MIVTAVPVLPVPVILPPGILGIGEGSVISAPSNSSFGTGENDAISAPGTLGTGSSKMIGTGGSFDRVARTGTGTGTPTTFARLVQRVSERDSYVCHSWKVIKKGKERMHVFLRKARQCAQALDS